MNGGDTVLTMESTESTLLLEELPQKYGPAPTTGSLELYNDDRKLPHSHVRMAECLYLYGVGNHAGKQSSPHNADLTIIDGNPLEDINVASDPENKSAWIMKGGVIYKDMLR